MTKPLLHWPLPRRRHRTFADLNFLIVDARQHCSPYGLESTTCASVVCLAERRKVYARWDVS
jgi:hypothetical protein